MNLPPLPEQRNVALIQGFEGSEYRNLSYDYCETTAKHSINQMRDYGALCRKMALEEAAGICDDISTQHNDTYKHKPGPNAYDPHYQGLSMGADECSEAIGGLK